MSGLRAFQPRAPIKAWVVLVLRENLRIHSIATRLIHQPPFSTISIVTTKETAQLQHATPTHAARLRRVTRRCRQRALVRSVPCFHSNLRVALRPRIFNKVRRDLRMRLQFQRRLPQTLHDQSLRTARGCNDVPPIPTTRRGPTSSPKLGLENRFAVPAEEPALFFVRSVVFELWIRHITTFRNGRTATGLQKTTPLTRSHLKRPALAQLSVRPAKTIRHLRGRQITNPIDPSTLLPPLSRIKGGRHIPEFGPGKP